MEATRMLSGIGAARGVFRVSLVVGAAGGRALLLALSRVLSLQWAPAARGAPCAPQAAACVWAPRPGPAGGPPLQEQRQPPA